ncbi:unnamed protein product [Macrosiphum euphorbiae]|uniref:Uncharacterized protein n=1 Tax=Macrosiphum euphorbiae TaxID=13131 RepID=A0AAV0Y0Y7_9HEMI|nr:unnamed protein product [Macrosiphum euphorbiae]
MEAKSFNLLSEEYDDIEYLELFGSEYLALDSEYQTEVSLQKIAKIESPRATMKAKAKYEREVAAKLTKYSLEPTYNIPASVRAIPTQPIKPDAAVNKINQPTTSTAEFNRTTSAGKQTTGASEVSISQPPTTEEDTPPVKSNNQRRREKYKENRKHIRQQRKLKK